MTKKFKFSHELFQGDNKVLGEYEIKCRLFNLLTKFFLPEYLTISKGLNYEIHEDGISCGVSGIGDCTDNNIILPMVYNNKNLTSIEDSAFLQCNSLTSIYIPDGVTSIGNNAFIRCTSLTSINIPDGVTSIGVGAFIGCTNLTSINIPDSVATIGGYAFYNTTSIQYYDFTSFNSTTPPELHGSSIFRGVDNYEIRVRTQEIADAWKLIWTDYADHIVVYES